jgi:AraC family transcriptional activator of pobA
MTTTIPVYGLYGERSEPAWSNFFNLEHLPERSRIYNWIIPPHIHETLLQLLYIREGQLDALCNNSRKLLIAPSLLLIPAKTVHALHYTPDTDGPSITVSQRLIETAATSMVPEMLPLLRTPTMIPIDRERDDEGIMQCYERIELELDQSDRAAIPLCVSQFMTLMIEVMRILNSLPEKNANTGAHSRKAAQIEKFLSIVDEKFREHLPIDFYANHMGMTTCHLSRLCREMLGSSTLDVINSRIIQEAQRDLVYTSQSVKQLAASLGFFDEAYFTRFFKKHVGASPRQYRSRVMKELFGEACPETANV